MLTRKTQFGLNNSVYCTGNLIKPVIVGFTYIASRQLFAQMTIAIMNPILVFAMLIFKKLIFMPYGKVSNENKN